ncbi:reverse transcriptase [Gossypium australe]|uniref:Reverse transcriptase n=1 Tax=Gossypium australe TaxID=47621 RepID=A0A5B6VZZ6_9ROSI|nr:reverse transcriptase [Gossypium australe]
MAKGILSSSICLPLSVEIEVEQERSWDTIKDSLFQFVREAFSTGRSTLDNILITQEAVHSMMRLQGQQGAMIFKIDLHKSIVLGQPFKIVSQGLTLSHVFFADNLLLFAKAKETLVSSLIVNLEKTKLFILSNIRITITFYLNQICEIHLTDDLGKYVGVPLIHKKSFQGDVMKKLRIGKANFFHLLEGEYLYNLQRVLFLCIQCNRLSYLF